MKWIIKIPEGACSFRKTSEKIRVCAGSPQRSRDPRISSSAWICKVNFPASSVGVTGHQPGRGRPWAGNDLSGPHRGPRGLVRVAEGRTRRRPGPARTGTSEGHRVSPTVELHSRHLIHESLKFSNCCCCEMSTIRCPDRNSMTQAGST